MTAKEKYDEIGTGYDQTRQADPYLIARLVALLKLQPERKYLDMGCGTGNYTSELMKKGIDIIGMDPSELMLSKAKDRYPSGIWLEGKAEHTDFPDWCFDGIMGTLTIHHWEDLGQAFHEINRILKLDGRLLLFTSTSEQMKGYWLNAYFPKMLDASIKQMPKYEHIASALHSSGFRSISTEKYFVKDDLQDLFLYCGKHRPELYLDNQVRNAISSFADLANSQEVRTGLQKLSKDIESNHIQEVIADYENDLGDYLFVVAERS